MAAKSDGSGRLAPAAARKALRDALAVVPMVVSRIELWRTSRLRLLDRNPRTHSAEQIDQIAGSLREFGFLWPVMVNAKSRRIVAGNGRFLAAQKIGLQVVPVVEESHLTPAQRRAFIIADNKIALNAGWDDEILAADFPSLEKMGLAGVTGFSGDEIEDILEAVSAKSDGPEEPPTPAVPARPVTRLGDVWNLGVHRVLCGDAASLADLMRVLEGARVDAVWTDPPYNVDYEGAAGKLKNDALPLADFADLLKGSFSAMLEVMKKGAPIYVAHSDTGGFVFRQAFIEAGFKLASCLIWKKNSLVLSRGDYHWQHEPILYGWRPGSAHRWFGARDKTTIFEFDGPPFQQIGDDEWQIVLPDSTLIVRGADISVEPARGTVFEVDKSASNADHPTQKPVALIQRMLSNSARRGSLVLDPFAGSGSTLIACEVLGLRGAMVDLDERYVDVLVQRWQNFTGRKASLAEGGVPFDEVGAERPEVG